MNHHGAAPVDDARVQPVEGSPFGDWHDRGDSVALDTIDWLPPVLPSSVIALWQNLHALTAKQQPPAPADPLNALRAPGSEIEVEIDGLGVLANRYG